MAEVIIAAGSNLGDRHGYLRKAGEFLSLLSKTPVRKSSIWESEPVGPALYTFLNCVGMIETELPVAGLLTPVPGGVGPMTVACLMFNTLQAARRASGLAMAAAK